MQKLLLSILITIFLNGCVTGPEAKSAQQSDEIKSTVIEQPQILKMHVLSEPNSGKKTVVEVVDVELTD